MSTTFAVVATSRLSPDPYSHSRVVTHSGHLADTRAKGAYILSTGPCIWQFLSANQHAGPNDATYRTGSPTNRATIHGQTRCVLFSLMQGILASAGEWQKPSRASHRSKVIRNQCNSPGVFRSYRAGSPFRDLPTAGRIRTWARSREIYCYRLASGRR